MDHTPKPLLYEEKPAPSDPYSYNEYANGGHSMSTKDEIRKALSEGVSEGTSLVKLVHQQKVLDFAYPYQQWYTKALRLVQTLAPERYVEFQSYYDPDPKRKQTDVTNYVIKDFIKGLAPKPNLAARGDFWDVANVTVMNLLNQIAILQSLLSRIDGVLANLEGSIAADFQDEELATARELSRVNRRAAGALAGVVLEEHLQRVARARSVNVSKRNPTIADLNDPLKTAGVYDIATWRKIQYLADIRNNCAHRKDTDPTPNDVAELIAGVNWAVKTIS